MWPFPKRAALPLAEIDHVVFGAVAEAIDPTPEMFAPVGIIIPDLEPVMPTHLSPEYHAGLAVRMIESLDADDARLTEAISTEISQHEALIAALHAELAGVRKVREAYKSVSVHLTPETPAPVIAGEQVSFGDVVSVKNGVARPIKPRRPKPDAPSTE